MFNLDYFKSEYMPVTNSVSMCRTLRCNADHSDIY